MGSLPNEVMPMKLATLRDRSRDGRLVVVSRDLTLCSDARHLAPTLQAALDDWDAIAPELELISRGIESGGQPVQRFHERDALAALPRAYQRIDPGSRHGARHFAPPRAGTAAGTASIALALLTGDLARGADAATALAAVRLVVLVSETAGLASLSPAAVTADEFAAGWGTLAVDIGGVSVARLDPALDLGALAARAAGDRALSAGCLVAAGPLVEDVPVPAGATLRVEIRDATQQTTFGAIEQIAGGALP